MQPRVVLYIGSFFFSLFTSLTLYIVLPYLSLFMSEASAGLVVAGGGTVAVVLFPFLPGLVARYGAQQLALVFSVVEMITLFALAVAPGAIPGALLIIVIIALQPFIAYELDLLLEATMSERSSAGRVRALFLTTWNVGVLAAPLLLGAVLATSDAYGRIFIVGAAALVPLVVLLTERHLPRGASPKLSHLYDTFRSLARDRDLAAVTVGHLLLWLFYVWGPLYAPIYLHTVLGIPWSSLGWMFAVMLIPYVLLEYPTGWIADKFLGDKELMFIGFLITGGALMLLSVLSPISSLAFILLILVGSRVGAALVESTTEGHFFRRVSRRDINSMSVFRGVWPLAYIIAPIVGSLILFFGNYQIFFILTGTFIALAGAGATLLIKDFR